jgi:hypothetical protein
MSQLAPILPHGKTPLQLRDAIERAIEPYLTTQTRYVAFAKMEEVFFRFFDELVIQQEAAERQ